MQIIGARVLMKEREAAVQLRKRRCAICFDLNQLSRFCDQGKGDFNWLSKGVLQGMGVGEYHM